MAWLAVARGERPLARRAMTIQDLSAATKELLARHIDSVIQLEILLMLRTGIHKPCRAEDVSQSLYITGRAAEDQLMRLSAAGFLTARENTQGVLWYYYEPASQKLAQQVDALALDYAQRRVRVVEWLYSTPSSSVRSFARAFRLRRDKDDE